ncbi:SHOCT domain-containing protein [Clostridium sp.]|uniref:SHOCT domain-containing protein n=1 Tax=Clostridium sp. TaxID=1506 RepID=UPI003D6D0CE4
MLKDIINNPMAVNIIGGVVGGIVPGGGILKRQITNVGKNIVRNAVDNQRSGGESQGNNRGNRIILNVQTGERVIKYTNYDIVKFIEPVGEEEYGFIKLQNSKYEHNSEEDVVFFFSQRIEIKKEAGQLCAFIRNEVDEINKVLVDSQQRENAATVQQVAATVQQVNTSIIADELLKFKQLLDMGAINQQEYEEMKKHLLGM